ncbi:hypothetical protein KCP73_04295 [Salmonella enterica subsp. enterica]|nr:hypothetical protein KCP73_04295 [Salmonella enterica subsp. enterica]
MTTIFTIACPSSTGRGRLLLCWWRYGRVTLSRVTRLHLYDAFFRCKSPNVLMPEPLSRLCWTWRLEVGLMTCYDLRFPDMKLQL